MGEPEEDQTAQEEPPAAETSTTDEAETDYYDTEHIEAAVDAWVQLRRRLTSKGSSKDSSGKKKESSETSESDQVSSKDSNSSKLSWEDVSQMATDSALGMRRLGAEETQPASSQLVTVGIVASSVALLSVVAYKLLRRFLAKRKPSEAAPTPVSGVELV